MTPVTHALNLLQDRSARTPASTHHRLQLYRYHFSEVEAAARISEELTIITTGAWEESVSTDRSHSSLPYMMSRVTFDFSMVPTSLDWSSKFT